MLVCKKKDTLKSEFGVKAEKEKEKEIPKLLRASWLSW